MFCFSCHPFNFCLFTYFLNFAKFFNIKPKNTKYKMPRAKNKREIIITITSKSLHDSLLSETNFICDFCGFEESRGRGYFERHLDKKHRTFTCNVCNQVFKQKPNLIEHLRAHFQRFICHYCGEETEKNEKLQKHIFFKHEPHNKELILSVQPKMSYSCRHCTRSFLTAVHRNSHEVIVHKGRDEPAFKCSDCNLIFITKDELRSHSYDHYTGTLHFCPQPNCDRFFKTASYLRSHAKIHAPANYKCDVRIENFKIIMAI